MILRLVLSLCFIFPAHLFATKICQTTLISQRPEHISKRVEITTQTVKEAITTIEKGFSELDQSENEALHRFQQISEELMGASAEVQKECAQKSAAQCPLLGRLFRPVLEFWTAAGIGLGAELSGHNPQAESFTRTFISELKANLSKDTFLGKHLLEKNAEGERAALTNFAQNLLVIYFFQALGFTSQWLTDPNFNALLVAAIPANTALMVYLQSNKAAKHTPLELGLPTAANNTELLSQLPSMMAGENGFKSEASNRFAGFLALWPLEIVAVAGLNSALEVLYPKGGGDIFSQNTPVEIIANAVVSMGIFGTYLAARWSVWDYWYNTRYLPGYKKMKEAPLALLDEKIAAKKLSLAEEQTDPELRILQQQRRSLWWKTAFGTKTFNFTYRSAICFVDAYIIFGLMGKWIPNWVHETLLPMLPTWLGGS